MQKVKKYHYGLISSQNRLVKPRKREYKKYRSVSFLPDVMHTKELDMLIIQVEMELNLHKTLCHFLVAQLQDLEPNVSRKH